MRFAGTLITRHSSLVTFHMPSEFRLILKHADEPGYTPDIECYLRHGGYDVLKKALAIQPKDLPDGKKLSGPEQIREDVKVSGLRGRGGAGFSCGLKWSFVDRKSVKPVYLNCNTYESEPGTFKKRQNIHKDPHQLRFVSVADEINRLATLAINVDRKSTRL